MDGILVIYKPAGITSHDVVNQVRNITEIKKVGHAGTLDPFAEGILIILMGKATKLQSKFMEMEKTYIGVLKLGETSDTYDPTGKIKKQRPKNKISKNKIQKTINSFIGEIKQTPPIYSAIKIKGMPAYKLARQEKKFQIKARKVKIYEINILRYEWPYLKIEVKCGKGTYIRSLANDIGKRLKCGAYLKKLIRTGVGGLDLKIAANFKNLNSKTLPKLIIPATIYE